MDSIRFISKKDALIVAERRLKSKSMLRLEDKAKSRIRYVGDATLEGILVKVIYEMKWPDLVIQDIVINWDNLPETMTIKAGELMDRYWLD